MLFSSEVRPDGRPGRTPGGAIGFCRESYGPPTSLAPDPVPGARRAPQPGVPARSAAVRAVGSALDGDGAPEPVGAHRGVSPGPAPDLQRFTWRLSAAVDATIAGVLFALAWRP